MVILFFGHTCFGLVGGIQSLFAQNVKGDPGGPQALIGYNLVRGVKELFRLRRPSSDTITSFRPPLPPMEWSQTFGARVFAALDLLESLVRKCLEMLMPGVDWLSSVTDSAVSDQIESGFFDPSPLDFFKYPNNADGMGSPNCYPHIDRGVRRHPFLALLLSVSCLPHCPLAHVEKTSPRFAEPNLLDGPCAAGAHRCPVFFRAWALHPGTPLRPLGPG